MYELAFSGLGLNPITQTPPYVNDLGALAGGSSYAAAASVALGLQALHLRPFWPLAGLQVLPGLAAPFWYLACLQGVPGPAVPFWYRFWHISPWAGNKSNDYSF